DRQPTRSLETGARSEQKQIWRRTALAFLGYAAAFGLVASSAVLPVSQAPAQATNTPATPTPPPTDTAKSGTERRQERRSGRAERRQERRTGRADLAVTKRRLIGRHEGRAPRPTGQRDLFARRGLDVNSR